VGDGPLPCEGERRNGRFVAINRAALVETLFEAELFGPAGEA
jgi:transcriptional regulator with PAS, ATPase and Fis domain